MAQIVRRLLGRAFDGRPLYAPKHCHSLLLSAAGGGKTTCGAMLWLMSLIADTSRTLIVSDCKEGEIAAQAANMWPVMVARSLSLMTLAFLALITN